MSADVETCEAVMTGGASAGAPVLFICEHASRDIPEEFGDLGLTEEARRSHIAWDPGAVDVARRLASRAASPLVSGTVSRLLFDCNRPPEAADAIPAKSEIYDIPGNSALTAAARRQRVETIYEPFVASVENAIETWRPQAIVTVHSFTPVYHGQRRQVELGLLHDADARLADAMLARTAMAGLKIERNQPYGPSDGVMHSLNKYARPRGLLNVMLEIRNDLIASAETQIRIADQIERLLFASLADCGVRLEAVP